MGDNNYVQHYSITGENGNRQLQLEGKDSKTQYILVIKPDQEPLRRKKRKSSGNFEIFTHKIFTDSFGLQSYIINGIRNSKTKNIALYQPLNILDMVVYYKKKKPQNKIKIVTTSMIQQII